MNQLLWLLRAKRWVQNPPSWGRVKLVLAVIGLCLALVVVERVFGWPDWMTVDSLRRKP
ncbi:hypothetical protein [Rhodobacter calidifons]|uniref:Uncharacterized protein n=1 Tax=Rhodobacter calidifons TaxID=2715277 RepID=A0ABX0G8L9_9RHOB|nr:hypothetical protein [Rhodobacter calidifons]NHB77451.1 hypothetical protein [Rhodobacter calidifons]